MKISKLSKWIIALILGICSILILTILLSPYKKNNDTGIKMVMERVTIDAPVSQVYQYLGNSNNASQWSTFVDHIVPLNAGTAPDGTIGSKRRCYKNADETGIVWDEEILINERNQRRSLSIFNMNGFSMQADNLRTEQIYEPVDSGKCELTFSLFFEPGKNDLASELKMYIAAYRVSSIFKKNLQNIKIFNERPSQQYR